MWMMAAMVGMMAVSTAMSAKAAADKGVTDQNAANAQAGGARRQAMEAETQSREVATQAQQDEQNRMDKLIGMQAASAVNAAASGISSDSASLQAIQQQNQDVVGRDLMNISYMGQSKSAALHRQAIYGREAGDTYERTGREARSAADAAMWGTIFKGASSIAMYGAMPSMGGAAGGSMFGAGAGVSPNA